MGDAENKRRTNQQQRTACPVSIAMAPLAYPPIAPRALVAFGTRSAPAAESSPIVTLAITCGAGILGCLQITY